MNPSPAAVGTDTGAELPATAYAVLGLLSFDRELSGYDLKKWADASLSHFYWAPAISHIYRELRRLEALGYVSAREVPQDELRNKRLFRLTDAGRAAAAAWVGRAKPEPVVLKHPTALRLWLGHLVAPETLDSLLEAHRREVAAAIASLDADLVKVSHDDELLRRFPEPVLRWARAFHEADLNATEQLLEMFRT